MVLGYNKMVTTYQIQLKLEVVLQQFIDVLLFASIIAFKKKKFETRNIKALI